MKNLAFAILAMGTLSASAAIIDGTPLVVAEGTTETVAAGQTQIIPYFYNYGTLTVGAGATLKVQGAANTSFGALGEGGTGTLNLLSSAQYSDFSGPIVVEAGTLLLARPLLPGQTVTVKSGAKFVPASSADLAFVTYEGPADQPAPNALYTINGNVTGGADLLGLAPAYDTERLGGPTVGVSVTLAGTVTHAPATSENPFTLVGQHKDAKLTLNGTGLNTVPLLVNGPGTFLFAGDGTFTVGDGMVALANGGIYGQTGGLTIRDPNALDDTLEDGGLSGSSIYLGRNGDNVNLTVATNGTLVTAGRVYLATNLSGEDRQHFGQSHLVVNGTVNAVGNAGVLTWGPAGCST